MPARTTGAALGASGALSAAAPREGLLTAAIYFAVPASLVYFIKAQYLNESMLLTGRGETLVPRYGRIVLQFCQSLRRGAAQHQEIDSYFHQWRRG